MSVKKVLRNNSREFGVAVAILLMFIVFGSIDNIYFAPSNLRAIIEQATIFGLIGVGITGIIITGGIDLSVGSALALMGCIAAQVAVRGYHPLVVVAIVLCCGLVLGTFNGFLVTKMKLQPFIATMGTMSIYRGLAFVVTDGLPVLGVPSDYRRLVFGEIFPYVRTSVLVFFVFTIFMYIVLRHTRFGTYIYAVGGNNEAARLSGIKVEKTKTMMYALGMVGTSLAALIHVGMVGTGAPASATGYELNAIAAAAIGGTSMAGGKGNVIGTMLGAILFAGLRVGLIVIGVDMFYQFIATGAVIIVASYLEIAQAKISSLRRKETLAE